VRFTVRHLAYSERRLDGHNDRVAHVLGAGSRASAFRGDGHPSTSSSRRQQISKACKARAFEGSDPSATARLTSARRSSAERFGDRSRELSESHLCTCTRLLHDAPSARRIVSGTMVAVVAVDAERTSAGGALLVEEAGTAHLVCVCDG